MVAPFIGGEVLFGADLTWQTFFRKYEDGAAVLAQPSGDALPSGCALLFLVRPDGRLDVRPDGRLDPGTQGSGQLPGPGDTVVLPVPGGPGAEGPPE
ncbi:hypothetical protein [Streptomyces europaeiscabiei]|uniref:hypothetical protein n=1 Tax=Streptomyces europaeiscabiei TaxID=146819 RepID=UPI0038D3B9FD